MKLPLQGFSTLVQTMAAAVQSASDSTLNLAAGSVTRAILEANASVALWMQWLAVQVLRASRAATSTGTDLDSWVADFGLARNQATPATGVVTFLRATPTMSASIPVGTSVKTTDGSQSFTIVASPGFATLSADGTAYVLSAGVATMDLPATAAAPGSAGNVQAGAITRLASPIAGVDSVSNALAFTNGLDPEDDVSLRNRFRTFIQSRSKATPLAIADAVGSVQQDLTFVLDENLDTSGNARPGNFVLTVDDGSGTPSSALLAAVQASVEAVRPVGVTFAVRGPTVMSANVTLSLATSSGPASIALVQQVSQTITSYVGKLPVGGVLAITRLAQLAYSADSSITNVTDIHINGAVLDLDPGRSGKVMLTSLSVA